MRIDLRKQTASASGETEMIHPVSVAVVVTSPAIGTRKWSVKIAPPSKRGPASAREKRNGTRFTSRTPLQQRGDRQPTPPDPLMEEYAGLLQSPLAYEARGMRALEDEEPATAAEIFREGLDLAPVDPSLRHRLGTTWFMMGDSRGAVEQPEETLRRSPEFARRISVSG